MISIDNLMSLGIRGVTPKFFIMDNNDTWVDFSDFLESNGVNLLKNISAIRYSSELKNGIYVIKIPGIKVSLSNEEGFFSKPFPSTIKNVYGATASFSDTTFSKFTSLTNKKARVSVWIHGNDGTFTEYVLGTYLIYGNRIVTETTMTLSLESLAYPLNNDDSAERVKDGIDWYRNRPIRFLITELLKLRYGEVNSDETDFIVPTSYIFPYNITIPTAAYQNSDSGEQRKSSSYGKLPELDSNAVWRNDGTYPMAACWGREPVTANGPIRRLFYGTDNQLWKWNPSTEVSEWIATFDDDYVIIKIFDNTLNDKIYAILASTAQDTYGRRTIKIYYYDGGGTILVSTLTHIYLCDRISMFGHTFLDGGKSTQYIGQQVGAEDCGENLSIPFRQYVEGYEESVTELLYMTRMQGVLSDSPVSPVDRHYGNGFLDPGFWSMLKQNAAGASGLLRGRFSFGQNGCFVFHRYLSSHQTAGALVYFKYDALTNNTFYLTVFDLDTLTETEYTSLGWATTDEDFDTWPITLCEGETDVLYAGWIHHDHNGSDKSVTKIYYYNLSGGGSQAQKYISSGDGDGKYFTPLEMMYKAPDAKNKKVYAVLYNRNKVGKYGAYRVVSFSSGTSAFSTFTDLERNYFTNQPHQLTGGSDSDIYFVEALSNSLYMIDVSEGEVVIKQGGVPVVSDESWCWAMAVDTNTRDTDIVYGISAPCAKSFLMNNDPTEGKFYLWKFDVYLTDRIEYADFSGLKVLEAISLMAQVCDHDYGFTRNGDFFLSVKPDEDDFADYEFVDEEDGNIGDIEIQVNERALYNYVKVVPYISAVDEPTAEYTQLPRDDGSEDFNYEMHVQQRDTAKKRLKLQCLAGGKITEKNILFRFYRYDEKIDTVLARNYVAPGDNYVYTNIRVDDIKKGDSIKIKSENGTDIATVSSDPDTTDKENKRIPVDNTDFSYSHPAGSRVEITRVSSGWSGKGNTNVETDGFFENWTGGDWDGVDTKTNIEDNEDTDVFLFSAQSNRLEGDGVGAPVYNIQYPAENFKADETYTVIVAVKGFSGDTSNPQTDVTINIDGTDVRNWTDVTSTRRRNFEFLVGSFDYPPYEVTNIDLNIQLSDNSGKAWIGGIFILRGDHQEPDVVSFGADDQFVPIGNTNVWMKFVAPSDEEGLFVEGDRIEITCYGMSLKKQEFFRSEYIDMDSESLYGLVAYDDIDNRFISSSYADDIARKIGGIQTNPPIYFKISMPLDLSILPYNETSARRTTCDLRSRKLLLKSPGFTERCEITSVQHDIYSGRTNLVLKSIAGA